MLRATKFLVSGNCPNGYSPYAAALPESAYKDAEVVVLKYYHSGQTVF